MIHGSVYRANYKMEGKDKWVKHYIRSIYYHRHRYYHILLFDSIYLQFYYLSLPSFYPRKHRCRISLLNNMETGHRSH